ncbi:YdeI/OmpD-associated family protein [Verrucomicrobium spinosum]|uniref:YdeI/OmpD-associated family protein n=2 Tax=Verrucomicrobium spinosum TaxID=2736 RepID=UPI0002F8BAD3|nr:YdeI/OmpD-associated family protein [Verrucomicrobium spinosum]
MFGSLLTPPKIAMDCRASRTQDPDDWIATCPGFTREICEELRDLIFRWEPDLKEGINSNMLCFSGRKRVCALGAFNDHVEIAFFRGGEVADPAGLFNHGLESLSIRGIKLKELSEVPKPALRAMLHAAVAVDRSPVVLPPPKVKREPWPMPAVLDAALKKHGKAAAFFESLKPTYQREYMVWISTAKRQETLEKRLAETLSALSAGKKWAQRKEA